MGDTSSNGLVFQPVMFFSRGVSIPMIHAWIFWAILRLWYKHTYYHHWVRETPQKCVLRKFCRKRNNHKAKKSFFLFLTIRDEIHDSFLFSSLWREKHVKNKKNKTKQKKKTQLVVCFTCVFLFSPPYPWKVSWSELTTEVGSTPAAKLQYFGNVAATQLGRCFKANGYHNPSL